MRSTPKSAMFSPGTVSTPAHSNIAPATAASLLMREEMEAGGGGGLISEELTRQLHSLLSETSPSTGSSSSSSGDPAFEGLSTATVAMAEAVSVGVGEVDTPTPAPAPAPAKKNPSAPKKSPASGGGGGTSSAAAAANGLPEVRKIVLEKLAPWNGSQHGAKTPQTIVWDYMAERWGQRRANELFPWWARSSFRRSQRPWLMPLRPGEEGYTWMPDDIPLVLLNRATNEGQSERFLRNYSIYCTLISRVHWLQTLYEEWNDEAKGHEVPRTVRLQLALWLDSHHMLMIFMEESSIYRDQDLMEEIHDRDPDPLIENRGAGRDDLGGITWFDLYCPSLRHVMHQGELPDLACLMPIIRWWNDVPRELLYTFEEDLRQYADLMGKADPRPQQSRSMGNISGRNILQYPRVAECFRRQLFVSLAGLYDYQGCGKVISHLWVRHELYRWFCMHPVGDEGLGTWINGFVLDDIKDLIVNHGKKKRKKKVKTGESNGLPPGLAELLAGAMGGDNEEEDHQQQQQGDDPDPYGQPSKILVGYNNEQVAKGYSNMSSFVQFVMNEYMYLMISRLPSLEAIMQRLHWHRVVERIYLDAADRIRLLMSQWFEPRPKITRMMHEYSVQLFDEVGPEWTGRQLLDRLALHYSPWLRWNTQQEMADALCPDRWRSREFQEYGLSHGACGHLIWSPRHMTLLETMLFRCRSETLTFCARFMHRTFSETIVDETGKLHVRRTPEQAAFLQGGKRWDSTLDIPSSDRRMMDLLVQYFHDKLPGQELSYLWMTPVFGLEFYPLMMLALAEHYFKLEVFRQASVNVLEAMLETNPREFFYIQYLMQRIERVRQVCLIRVPQNTAELQAKAFVQRFESMTGFSVGGDPQSEAVLPFLWDVGYYCEEHMELKHYLVDENPHRETQAGVNGVVTDPTTGKLWCSTNLLRANRTPKPDPRAWIQRAGIIFDVNNRRHRLLENGQCEDGDPKKAMWEGWRVPDVSPSAQQAEEDLQQASSSGGSTESTEKKNDKARCVFALYSEKTDRLNCQSMRELKALHWCGTALALGSKTYVACPRCAGITLHQADRFCSPIWGFLCPGCQQEVATIAREEARIKNAGSDHQLLFHCYLCAYDKWVPSNRVHRFQMLDDLDADDKPAHFRWAYFCDRHLPAYVGSSSIASRLSTVLLVSSKRIAAIPQYPPTTSTPETPSATPTTSSTTTTSASGTGAAGSIMDARGQRRQWRFITTKSESRFQKSFERTSRRLARIHQRDLR